MRKAGGWGSLLCLACTLAAARPADGVKTLLDQGKDRQADAVGKAAPDAPGTPLFDFYFGIAALNGGVRAKGCWHWNAICASFRRTGRRSSSWHAANDQYNRFALSLQHSRQSYQNINSFPDLSGIRFNDAASLAAAFRSIGRPVGASAAAAAYRMYAALGAGSNTRLGSHHAWGDTAQIQLPGSGTAQYKDVSGTAPTDNYGRVGSFSGSNLLMDFCARQIKTSNAVGMRFDTHALQSTATV